MSDDKKAMITASKESGLGDAPTLWTNNGNLIGILNKFRIGMAKG
jgi:hypothetical protein